jgi:endonuclease YncB( thermonuclease family)
MTHMNPSAIAVIVAFSLILGFLFPCALASTISVDASGTVLSVIDGSSFTLTSGETVKLAGIDTPIIGAVGYEASRGYLAGMIQGKTV